MISGQRSGGVKASVVFLLAAALLFAWWGASPALASKKVTFAQPQFYDPFIEQEHFAVGADLFSKRKEIVKAFDDTLVRINIYPVLISFENTSDEPLIIRSTTMHLTSKKSGNVYALSPEDLVGKVHRAEIVRAMMTDGPAGASLAGNKLKYIVRDYEDKVLPVEWVIEPGQRAGGFAFFQFERGVKPKKQTLKMRVKGATSGSITLVELPF